MNILANPSDNYRRWADGKLEGFTDKMDDLLVEINNPLSISTAEKSQINQIIKSAEFLGRLQRARNSRMC